MKQPKPPPAPDPAESIREQGRQNRINVVSPFGSVQYTDAAGQPVSEFTRIETLTPSQQRQFEQRNLLGEALLGIAQEQVPQFDLSPFQYETSGVAERMVGRQTELLQPEFRAQEERLIQDLSNRGIPEGSELWNDQMRLLRESQGRTLTGVAQQADITGFQQGVTERQQRYNELAALLGGQQLTPTNVPTPQIDVQGPYNAAQAQRQANFQAQSQQAQAFNQGLFSLGAAGIGGFFGA